MPVTGLFACSCGETFATRRARGLHIGGSRSHGGTGHDPVGVQAAAPHGTNTRYTKDGCRCVPCKRAHAAVQRQWKRENIPDRAHGTEGGYVNWHCRCDRCKAAAKLAQQKRRGKTPV